MAKNKRTTFEISMGERDALKYFLGVVCGDFDIDDKDNPETETEYQAFEKIKSQLSEEEISALSDLNNTVIDDEYEFPSVDSHDILDTDIGPLTHALELADKPDPDNAEIILPDDLTLELGNVLEKLKGEDGQPYYDND